MAKKIINSIDRTALTPNYAPAWFTPIKGKKSILWDSNGNNYVEIVKDDISSEDAELLILGAAIEADIAELEDYEERKLFLL